MSILDWLRREPLNKWKVHIPADLAVDVEAGLGVTAEEVIEAAIRKAEAYVGSPIPDSQRERVWAERIV